MKQNVQGFALGVASKQTKGNLEIAYPNISLTQHRLEDVLRLIEKIN